MTLNVSLTEPLQILEAHLSFPEKIILATVMVVSTVLFFIFLGKKIELIRKGEPTNRFNNIGRRIWNFVRDVIFQYRVIKGRPFPGILHALVMWGFFAFLLEKIYHFTKAFLPLSLYEAGGALAGVETFYNVFLGKFFFVFAFIVLFGVIGLSIRRGIIRPKSIDYPGEAWLVLGLIATIMATFLVPFFLETKAENETAVTIAFWIHNAAIFTFLVYIPLSKHLHLLFCPFGEFLKNFEIGQLRPLDLEDEEKEDYGVNTLENYSWKDLFDTFACIHCGRCNDRCPAFNTDKTLEPRKVILNLQDALTEKKFEEPLVGDIIPEAMIWQCTTCGGCEFHCPVGIEHVPKIIGLRRFKTAESEFPKEAQNTFNGLERNGNPWNYGSHLREEALGEIDAPIFEKAGQYDYLLWMGCFANYDASYRASIAATVKVLKAAGVSFGVLPEEVCCGDPARRLGNEFLFSALIEGNIEMFKELQIKKVITACPHCLQTLLNDYSDFDIDLEVIHHSVLIEQLLAEGKLACKAGEGTTSCTYHDPCYMSRYRKTYNEPRHALANAGVTVNEMQRSKETSFCCGGGGGTIFLEESEGTRINHNRADEIIATGEKETVVSCPYCYTMLKDAMGDKGKSEEIAVRDIAEVIAEKL